MYKQKSAQAGFSMIELLIAVVILAIGLLGLAELQVTAIKVNAHSDSITVANALAQKAVEDIAAMSAEDDIFATPVTGDTWAGSPFTISGAGVYNVTYDVVPNYETVTGLSQITIHVRSDNVVANVLGNKVRSVDVITFKRSF
ncbi:MAG: type IV pilus modification protein PilV [Desulfuromonadales bacterium]|nr:type IV pilus modification protein PilV [Desulfuromonadales bacterium]